MKKLTILVDMDDTIENLSEAWVSYLNSRYGTNVSVSDISSWDISQAFPTLSKTEVYGALKEGGTVGSGKAAPWCREVSQKAG